MFPWLIVHTVTTAAAAVVVAAACRWSRLGPAARHLLWLVVLIKLLTPPVVYWPWPLPPFGSAPAAPAPAAPTNGPAPAAVRVVVIDEEPATDPAPAIRNTESIPPVAAPPAPPAAPTFSWDELPTAAAWAWLAGAVFVALRNGICIHSWRRRLARGLPAPDWLVEAVRDLAGSMGLRPPRLVVLPGAASPMVWGFGAPQLIWPHGLEDRLSAVGQRAVLLHELAHLRRRDHWVGWLLLAGGCMWWWHPLFWWVRRRLMQEAELACDASVVGAAPDGRRAYAEALLEVSQRVASTAAVPALGAAGGRRDLERRLVMIMRGPATRRLSWAGLAGVGVLGLLALPAWTLGENPPPAAPPSVEPPAQTTPPVADPLAGVTPPVAPPSGVVAPAPAADADRDAKIRELETKVQQLLKEIRKLRDQTPATPATPLPPPNFGRALGDFETTGLPAPANSPAAEAPAEVITLTRVSYKLKPATAEALAAFLKDNVKADILETKVDTEGDNLTITTTPEAQHAIGQFIGLIQGKTPIRRGMMGPSGMGPGPGGSGGLPSGGTFGPGPAGSARPYGPGPGASFPPGEGFPGPGGTPPPGGTSHPPEK